VIVTATVTSMDTVTEGYTQWCPSMDTVTEGYAQWCPSMDGQWMVTAVVE